MDNNCVSFNLARLKKILSVEGEVTSKTEINFLSDLIEEHSDYHDICEEAVFDDDGKYKFVVHERLIDDSPQLFVRCYLHDNHVPLKGFKNV